MSGRELRAVWCNRDCCGIWGGWGRRTWLPGKSLVRVYSASDGVRAMVRRFGERARACRRRVGRCRCMVGCRLRLGGLFGCGELFAQLGCRRRLGRRGWVGGWDRCGGLAGQWIGVQDCHESETGRGDGGVRWLLLQHRHLRQR